MQPYLELFMNITIILAKLEFLALKGAMVRAVSGIPSLETICCQNQQKPTHLHHDHS